MIRLQSMDEYDKIVEFDFLDKKNIFYSKKENPEKRKAKKNGNYSIIEGNFLALFRFNNELHFRANEKDFVVDDDTKIEFKKGEEKNFFKVTKDNKLFFELVYASPVIDPPLEEDFVSSFVEEEHFDFCLFIYNVVSNRKRRESFFRK